MLVTIEGIDGTGKSTLIEGLKTELADLSPVFTREPGSSWVGEAVRRGIKEEINPIAEALLFVADHAVHVNTVIKPALRENKLVISDRYSDSRYVYQSKTLKGHIADPVKWLKDMQREWTVVPDITFLLVLPVEESLRRINAERESTEHFESENVLSEVQANYLKIAEEEPKRFVMVDAKKDRDEIVKFVASVIRAKMHTGKGTGKNTTKVQTI